MCNSSGTKKRILVTGSSRGLGLEFVKQFLQKGNFVIASSRKPYEYSEFKKIKTDYKDNFFVVELDVSNKDSRKQAFNIISQKVDGLDILVNNAGIRFGGEKYNDELGKLEKEDFSRIFQVNTVAPLMMTEKFLPLLCNVEGSKVINISSSSGCITKRSRKGGGYSYSSSKAALNMVTKALSIDLTERGVIVASLHPGWVKTTMEYTENAPLMPEESVKGLIKVIESLSTEDTGKFIDWQGDELPW